MYHKYQDISRSAHLFGLLNGKHFIVCIIMENNMNIQWAVCTLFSVNTLKAISKDL